MSGAITAPDMIVGVVTQRWRETEAVVEGAGWGEEERDEQRETHGGHRVAKKKSREFDQESSRSNKIYIYINGIPLVHYFSIDIY